ncbi:LVIVD repeat-containing protein [Actinokineospora sp. HUAS TT18]|uniref:LVIVD repeat-containing protein n=1 Tax=Actinokineospora sp. HUAS TT18 TaxID=3447451 RepID=UPI003F51F774
MGVSIPARLAAITSAFFLLGAPVAVADPEPDDSPAAVQADPDLGQTNFVTSDNVRQVANVPHTAPLTQNGGRGSDLAFTGDYAIGGNYAGFTIYNIKHPHKPYVVSQVLCPGSQGDVTVHGDLLFYSVDSRRSDDSCSSVAQNDGTKPYWEGIRIFDISDKANPRYVKSVESDCGSHTHTLVPDKEGVNAYLYISSYGPSPSIARCKPPHDKISIVKVPLADPAAAAVVATPVLFGDGGNPGKPGTVDTGYVTATSGCHDITAFPDKDIAAGACMGDGVLFDITDRANPKVITRVQDDTNFAFWHSATFNNDATKVVFTDELGGGGAATCKPTIAKTRGADGIYDLVGQGSAAGLRFRSYFKIPRDDTEICVAHNGSVVPAKGRDIMVQSWYKGGVSIWDFTDSANPTEIGYFNPLPERKGPSGTWSAYWYNGYIYSMDGQQGLDVLEVLDPRTNQAKSVHQDVFNAQTQYSLRQGQN